MTIRRNFISDGTRRAKGRNKRGFHRDVSSTTKNEFFSLFHDTECKIIQSILMRHVVTSLSHILIKRTLFNGVLKLSL